MLTSSNNPLLFCFLQTLRRFIELHNVNRPCEHDVSLEISASLKSSFAYRSGPDKRAESGRAAIIIIIMKTNFVRFKGGVDGHVLSFWSPGSSSLSLRNFRVKFEAENVLN